MSHLKFEIRPLNSAQLGEICTIHNSAFTKWITDLGLLYGYHFITKNDVLKWIESVNSQILVAYEGTEPIGYLHCGFESVNGKSQRIKIFTIIETSEGSGQSKIAVLPEKQNKGIATALLEHAIKFSQDQNAEIAILYSYNHHQSMNKILPSMGFLHEPVFYYPPYSRDKPLVHDTVLAEFDLSQEISRIHVEETPDVHIREFRVKDLPDIQQIFTECRPDIHEKYNNQEFGFYWLEQKWAEKTLVAELNGEVVGCMEYDDKGVIGILGVKKAHQRKKVGSKLLYEILIDMKIQGYLKALADTGVIYQSAVMLYNKLNFNISRELWAWVKLL